MSRSGRTKALDPDEPESELAFEQGKADCVDQAAEERVEAFPPTRHPSMTNDFRGPVLPDNFPHYSSQKGRPSGRPFWLAALPARVRA
jgi:hypothetical protein